MFSRSADRARRYALEHEEDWIEPQKPRRDWKKVFLVLGLGTLSWVATYVGMLELIQANMGQLDFTTKIVVGFSVAMLMTMIIWLLDQMFAPHPFVVKFSYVVGYVFLTLISVGFGFGFYWKVLESRSEASRSAESAVSQVQASLLAGSSRLDQLQSTLEQLTLISQEKAILERDKGTSCPNSRPGDGPRRRLRDDDAGKFSFASNFVKGRSGKVKADMRGLDGDLKMITSSDASTFDKATGTRNKFLQALSRKLELTATSFNAFRTDPQLRQIRSELAERANRSTFPTGNGNGTFSCPDGQLQSALLGVVKAIDQLPELGKPEIATVEGAQAVVEAFRRLTATGAGLLVFKLPPSADELRALQTRAVRSVSPNAANRRSSTSASGLSQGGLSQRDYIPLSIAMFVDLCLLLVSIGRPMNRLGGLVPKMREAEQGPVYQILSKFDDIHRDQKIREKFEVFRHVVFDFNGDYYVAVPLDAPRNRNPDEVKNLQLEAHLLANLFASFEKEKIFSRVYNPLLSRKTIQKKLWRQGSKFAASQAFRTYRFRDGAWSDIILGAVMGAARRAKADRLRRAEEEGPQLDATQTATASIEAQAEARAREIIAATLGEQSAGVKQQFEEPAFTVGENAVALAQTKSADASGAFGPYADSAESERASGQNRTDEQSAEKTFGPIDWPYRKPPAAPGEADVDLLPANSNTTPSRVAADSKEPATDNVILMPLPSGQAADGPVDAEVQRVAYSAQPAQSASQSDAHPSARSSAEPVGEAPAYADILARAISIPSGAPEHVEQIVEAPEVEAVVEPAPEGRQVPPPLPVSPKTESSMNVRITQRTADIQIPIETTGDAQPIEMVKAGMRAAFSAPADTADQQELTDGSQYVAGVVTGGPEVLSLEAHDVTAKPDRDSVLMLHAPEDIEDIADVEIFDRASERRDLMSDDDLEEISRRFAPKQGGE